LYRAYYPSHQAYNPVRIWVAIQIVDMWGLQIPIPYVTLKKRGDVV
jgi:hypothetical protein